MIVVTADNPDWPREHTRQYLESGGREGHYIDFGEVGGKGPTPTLLLRTIGRKSGKAYILPLLYGRFGEEYAIIASKGGAPRHPAWFGNIEASDRVAFQVATEAYEATWRIAEGDERQRVWDAMVEIYPPFADYQKKTERQIPVVMLKPVASRPTFDHDA